MGAQKRFQFMTVCCQCLESLLGSDLAFVHAILENALLVIEHAVGTPRSDTVAFDLSASATRAGSAHMLAFAFVLLGLHGRLGCHRGLCVGSNGTSIASPSGIHDPSGI